MVCQQSVGINGIGFYTSETFVAAGKFEKIHVDFEKSKHISLFIFIYLYFALQHDLQDFLQKKLVPQPMLVCR